MRINSVVSTTGLATATDLETVNANVDTVVIAIPAMKSRKVTSPGPFLAQQ